MGASRSTPSSTKSQDLGSILRRSCEVGPRNAVHVAASAARFKFRRGLRSESCPEHRSGPDVFGAPASPSTASRKRWMFSPPTNSLQTGHRSRDMALRPTRRSIAAGVREGVHLSGQNHPGENWHPRIIASRRPGGEADRRVRPSRSAVWCWFVLRSERTWSRRERAGAGRSRPHNVEDHGVQHRVDVALSTNRAAHGIHDRGLERQRVPSCGAGLVARQPGLGRRPAPGGHP